MKALLLKDSYVLLKQMKLFLVLMAVFAAVPSSSLVSFAFIYSAMLPYTALAFDERAKWDTLATMMPYTSFDIVASKYVLGNLCTGGIFLVAMAGRLVTWRAKEIPMLLMLASAGLLLMALTLPLMFKWGVEKGRMFFVFIMVALAMASSTAATFFMGFDAAGKGVSFLLPVCALGVVALCQMVSIRIAVRCYDSRKK